MLSIKYIYHSCYLAETEQALLIFDYWQDPQSELHNLLATTTKQVYFFVSHFHEDHYNPEILTWQTPNAPEPKCIISYDTKKRRRVDPQQVSAVLHATDQYQDEILTATAFRSTDVGISTLVTLADGTTIFHAGDLNNWYFPKGNERLKVSVNEMEGLYMSILREIRQHTSHIDHVMFPIDPRLGEYTHRGATQWLLQIDTSHLYPMHTWQQPIESYLDILRDNFDTTIHSI